MPWTHRGRYVLKEKTDFKTLFVSVESVWLLAISVMQVGLTSSVIKELKLRWNVWIAQFLVYIIVNNKIQTTMIWTKRAEHVTLELTTQRATQKFFTKAYWKFCLVTLDAFANFYRIWLPEYLINLRRIAFQLTFIVKDLFMVLYYSFFLFWNNWTLFNDSSWAHFNKKPFHFFKFAW